MVFCVDCKHCINTSGFTGETYECSLSEFLNPVNGKPIWKDCRWERSKGSYRRGVIMSNFPKTLYICRHDLNFIENSIIGASLLDKTNCAKYNGKGICTIDNLHCENIVYRQTALDSAIKNNPVISKSVEKRVLVQIQDVVKSLNLHCKTEGEYE